MATNKPFQTAEFTIVRGFDFILRCGECNNDILINNFWYMMEKYFDKDFKDILIKNTQCGSGYYKFRKNIFKLLYKKLI